MALSILAIIQALCPWASMSYLQQRVSEAAGPRQTLRLF